MAARVNNSEVRAILTTGESASLTDAQIDAAIANATIIVDGFASSPCYLADDDGGTARAKQVELNLSADIAVGTTGGGTVEQEKIGDASQKFVTSKDGQSQYYRTATMLDCSGQLVDAEKPPAQMFTIGSHGAGNTRPSDES